MIILLFENFFAERKTLNMFPKVCSNLFQVHSQRINACKTAVYIFVLVSLAWNLHTVTQNRFLSKKDKDKDKEACKENEVRVHASVVWCDVEFAPRHRISRAWRSSMSEQ